MFKNRVRFLSFRLSGHKAFYYISKLVLIPIAGTTVCYLQLLPFSKWVNRCSHSHMHIYRHQRRKQAYFNFSTTGKEVSII